MTHRLYGRRAWRRRRQQQLTDEPYCRFCRQCGLIVPATVADHIVPHRGDYDAFMHGALQSLCKPCHDGAKQSADRTGHVRGVDAKGMPLDPDHPWHTQAPSRS